jgi:hypothetical protein
MHYERACIHIERHQCQQRWQQPEQQRRQQPQPLRGCNPSTPPPLHTASLSLMQAKHRVVDYKSSNESGFTLMLAAVADSIELPGLWR